jgi:hypothetical protein
MQTREKNLGGARMIAGAGAGEIAVRSGDALFSEIVPAMIKIDVEGMEMDVLAGLRETIARTRPTLFIEVDRANSEAFERWRVAAGYRTVKTFQRYRANTNFLIVPEDD